MEAMSDYAVGKPRRKQSPSLVEGCIVCQVMSVTLFCVPPLLSYCCWNYHSSSYSLSQVRVHKTSSGHSWWKNAQGKKTDKSGT